MHDILSVLSSSSVFQPKLLLREVNAQDCIGESVLEGNEMQSMEGYLMLKHYTEVCSIMTWGCKTSNDPFILCLDDHGVHSRDTLIEA